jgi:Rps23 Pro-64 3,4-dihydroxylase Tpa1-like proline 4-hydroxylase
VLGAGEDAIYSKPLLCGDGLADPHFAGGHLHPMEGRQRAESLMILNSTPPFGFFEPEAAAVGLKFRDRYTAAKPFPHIILEDFLNKEMLDLCLREFPPIDTSKVSYGRSQESLKFEFNPENVSPAARMLFYSFNSRPFIGFLENLTGISGLIPDPHFTGGGFHQVNQGGHLDIHADFNCHSELKLERRLNVLIYLNKQWKKEYGGNFEIWNQTMSKRCLSIEPIFNRCVVFDTSPTSFHGHPEPVNHPAGLPRRSIALYYYTATWDPSRRVRTTQFKVRPNSRDAFDLRMSLNELSADLVPPFLIRNVRRLFRFVMTHQHRIPRGTST